MLGRSLRRLAIGGMLVCAAFYPSIGLALTQGGDARESRLLDQYLKSRNLNRLQIRQVEIELSRELDRDRRRALAIRLARLYEQRLLFRQAVDADGGLPSRAKNLMQQYPIVASLNLRLAILHAQYVDAQARFESWWDEGRIPAGRAELIDRFFDLQRQLDDLQDLNQLELDQARAAPDLEEQEIIARARRLAIIENRILHTHYLAGWANYFLGVLPYDNDDQRLKSAGDNFVTFLQLESDKPAEQYDAKWFDFASIWNIRAVVGLAMVLGARQKFESSQYCFDLIETGNTDIASSVNLDVWRFRSLAYAKHWQQAELFAKDFQAMNRDDRQRATVWGAVVRTAMAVDRDAPDVALRLSQMGLLGLARRFQIQILSELVESEKINLSNSDFHGLWLRGYLTYYRADQNGTDLNPAGEYLRSALAFASRSVGNEIDPNDVARCRYLVGLINFRQRDFQTSADTFGAVARQLRASQVDLAAEAQWMRVLSLIEISRVDIRRTSEALVALDDMATQFPDSRFDDQIEFEKLRLQAGLMPADEAVGRLSMIPENHPLYARARFEMLHNQYRYWRELHDASSSSEPAEFERLLQIGRQYLQIENHTTGSSRLDSLLLVLDAKLTRGSSEQDVDQTIREAEQLLAETAPNDRKMASRLIYSQFLAAQKFGHSDDALQHARWLSRNCPGTLYQRSALIFLAQQIEPQLESAAQPSPSQISDAIDVYRKLTEVLGKTKDDLTRSGNARVALSKLNELYLIADRNDDAREGAELLHGLFPDNQRYITNLARVYTRLDRAGESLPLWRRLAKGVQPGSDLWYEAKYQLIKCLAKQDLASAQSVYRQTVHLSGDMPQGWKTRFDTLSLELEAIGNPEKNIVD